MTTHHAISVIGLRKAYGEHLVLNELASRSAARTLMRRMCPVMTSVLDPDSLSVPPSVSQLADVESLALPSEVVTLDRL